MKCENCCNNTCTRGLATNTINLPGWMCNGQNGMDDHTGSNLQGANRLPVASFTETMVNIDEPGVSVKRKRVERTTLCMFLAI